MPVATDRAGCALSSGWIEAGAWPLEPVGTATGLTTAAAVAVRCARERRARRGVETRLGSDLGSVCGSASFAARLRLRLSSALAIHAVGVAIKAIKEVDHPRPAEVSRSRVSSHTTLAYDTYSTYPCTMNRLSYAHQLNGLGNLLVGMRRHRVVRALQTRKGPAEASDSVSRSADSDAGA